MGQGVARATPVLFFCNRNSTLGQIYLLVKGDPLFSFGWLGCSLFLHGRIALLNNQVLRFALLEVLFYSLQSPYGLPRFVSYSSCKHSYPFSALLPFLPCSPVYRDHFAYLREAKESIMAR